ncbi:MAG: DciA family protein [Trichodesmium sp. MAG_R03]|nr:DciA family protein [Trichodesmium sp. MAG_R03]
MDFQSLNQILASLKIMEQLPQQKQFQKVMECWEELLGVMAIKTQPLYIKQEILYVATSSPTLSQELSFRVPQLLEKLNHLLSKPLDNIRFSAAQWHTYYSNKSGQNQNNDWLEHPSMISKSEKLTLLKSTHKNQNPQTTFENWAKAIKTRSQILPMCPQCQCPTPPGEIERWSVCAICATKQWSLK